jgi:hypothetical protein
MQHNPLWCADMHGCLFPGRRAGGGQPGAGQLERVPAGEWHPVAGHHHLRGQVMSASGCWPAAAAGRAPSFYTSVVLCGSNGGVDSRLDGWTASRHGCRGLQQGIQTFEEGAATETAMRRVPGESPSENEGLIPLDGRPVWRLRCAPEN